VKERISVGITDQSRLLPDCSTMTICSNCFALPVLLLLLLCWYYRSFAFLFDACDIFSRKAALHFCGCKEPIGNQWQQQRQELSLLSDTTAGSDAAYFDVRMADERSTKDTRSRRCRLRRLCLYSSYLNVSLAATASVSAVN